MNLIGLIKKIIPFTFLLIMSCSPEQSTIKKEYKVWTPNVDVRIPYILSYSIDSTKFPRSIHKDSTVRVVASKDWTSGFYPGSLLQLYKLTGDSIFLNKAKLWLPFIAKEQWNGRTHDMGFKVFCSIGGANKIAQNPKYEEVILQSARTLSTRYDSIVGCIKSWDFGTDKWQYPVIIDNMMNLELLFEATQLSGDSSFYNIAISHAEHTRVNHYREDFSCYHVIDYDLETGVVVQKLTHQGFSAESVWSRGQAWGLYGFTMAYRYTNDQRFLNHAKNIARFIINQSSMPEDGVPYWDMKDPSASNAPRDASAAAIYASALYELFSYTDDATYSGYADKILNSLGSEAYVLDANFNVPFILSHSTGNWPKNDEIDLPISYADYYFLEALNRKKVLSFD